MKRHNIALALAFGAILLALPLQAQTKAHRVLFAMTSPDEADWQLTLNNIRNLISGMAPETVEIELVAYGPGIAFLKKDGVDAAEIQKLESSHVHFIACSNAMRKQHLEASDLVSGSEVVPAGIVEVVKKQEQGWSYIKAGR
jgi:intracellular sulfur oxidation DsrE/DsrF family protein